MAIAFDHTHSAHWLPVHIHDLKNLPQSIVKEFQDHGHWVITKTMNHVSAMPIDQALPVHIHDLKNLPQSIVKEFQDHGHWVVTKTINHVSAMPIDKAMNKTI